MITSFKKNSRLKEIASVLVSRTSIYLLIYLAFSVIGLAVIPFAFSFHLLDALQRFKILRDLFQIVFYKNRRILLETALLLVVCLYIYAVLGFWLFNEDYTEDFVNYQCETLVQCMKKNTPFFPKNSLLNLLLLG